MIIGGTLEKSAIRVYTDLVRKMAGDEVLKKHGKRLFLLPRQYLRQTPVERSEIPIFIGAKRLPLYKTYKLRKNQVKILKD